MSLAGGDQGIGIRSPQSTLPQEVNQQPWWQLVYCRQWFLRDKQVENYRLKGFEETTAVVGANLVYLRKPQQLEGKGKRGIMPYVLVTTFHEVKTCMDILARQDPQSHPILTVVICDVKVNGQHGRASRWAANQSEPIYVLPDLHCPSTLVHGMPEALKHFLNKSNLPNRLSPSEQNAWSQLKAYRVSDQASASASAAAGTCDESQAADSESESAGVNSQPIVDARQVASPHGCRLVPNKLHQPPGCSRHVEPCKVSLPRTTTAPRQESAWATMGTPPGLAVLSQNTDLCQTFNPRSVCSLVKSYGHMQGQD